MSRGVKLQVIGHTLGALPKTGTTTHPSPVSLRDRMKRLDAPVLPHRRGDKNLAAHLVRRARGTSRMQRTTRRLARSSASRDGPLDDPPDESDELSAALLIGGAA
jgi:hypothetical protein